MLSTTAADATAIARFRGLLANHLDGVVSVPASHDATLAAGTLGRLLAGLLSVPSDVERIAYVDDNALDSLGIEPVLRMISWLDDDHAAVVRAVPVTDALKEVDGHRMVGSVDRAALYAPQPPHIIRREALDAALLGGYSPLIEDPAGLLVAAGHAVRIVVSGGLPLTLLPAP